MIFFAPVLQTGLHPHSCHPHLQPEDRFRFTPIKSLKPLPRPWDRKLSTPLAARGSRKLWKRFQPSFDKTKAQQAVAEKESMDDEMDIAINYAGTFHYLRPVKRLCLGLCDEDIQKWELSFLDTKWELGIKKRRKSPSSYLVSSDSRHNASSQSSTHSQETSNLPRRANEDDKDSVLAAVRELTPEQESGLVRTALRSSLEEDDTQLLNDFLSKAQAKRAARMAAQDAEPEVSQPQDLEIGCHTPPRKALDDLDKNSPSPTKGQFSAPKTNESAIPVPVEPASKETRVEESQPPANPVTEQSTETPQPNPPQVRRPAIRNTFLRRAKGMESILRSLSKGEEEFEMETKRNTAHNTGEMLPGHRLLAMDLGLSAESLSLNQYRRTSEKSPEEPDQEKVKKHVSWRRTRFIEYETGESCDYFSDTSSPPRPKRIRKKKRERNANTNSRERPSHAQTSQNDSENETETEVPAPAPAPTLPAASNTRARRARQLCPSS